MGSWLEGAPQGERVAFDLPTSGPGSPASLLRRVVALVVDWSASMLVATAFLGDAPFYPLAVFAVVNVLLVSTLGTTIGHRLLGVQVVRLDWALRPATDGRRPMPALGVGLGRAALRTVLLCLVLPAVVWDAEGRGLHDRGAGTLIVQSR